MERLYAPWRMAYIEQPHEPNAGETGCVFCDAAASADNVKNLVVHRGESAFVVLNKFPYNSGHLLIVPYTHTAKLDDLTDAATTELLTLAKAAQRALEEVMHPEGYNLGMNLGTAGGAGIADHLHLHVVPRWNGDTNFMPVLTDVKVMPDSLEHSYLLLRAAWN